MRLNRVCRLIPVATASLLAAMATQASIVDYTATGRIEQVDNSWMLPSSLSSAAPGQTFSFSFSVDTTTPGSGSTGDVSFLNAVQSASYKLGGITTGFSMGDNSVEVLDNSSGFTGYIMNGGDPVSADFTGTAGAVSFVTLAYSGAPLHLYTNTSLSNSPLSASHADFEDDLTIYYTSYVDGAAETISDVLVGPLSIKQSSGTVSAPEIDPSSLPAALSLLLGIAAVMGARRKRGTAVG